MIEDLADSHSGSNFGSEHTYADESSIDEIENFMLNSKELFLYTINCDYVICTF